MINKHYEKTTKLMKRAGLSARDVQRAYDNIHDGIPGRQQAQTDQGFQTKEKETQMTRNHDHTQCLTGVKLATTRQRGLRTKDEGRWYMQRVLVPYYQEATINSRLINIRGYDSNDTTRDTTNWYARAPQLPTTSISNDTGARLDE
eukprot:6165567-Amphidinium_carterae.1